MTNSMIFVSLRWFFWVPKTHLVDYLFLLHILILKCLDHIWGIEIGICYAVVMKLTSVVFSPFEWFFDNAVYDIAQDLGNLSLYVKWHKFEQGRLL